MRILLIFLAVAFNSYCKNSTHSQSVQNTMPSMDTSIHVAANHRFNITVPVSLGTGYRWELGDSLDKKKITLDKTLYAEGAGTKPGGSGTQTFVFRAIAKGRTKIKLVYLRPWDKTSKNAEKVYTIIIE